MRQSPDFGDPSYEKNRKDPEPKCKLMDTKPAEVNARTETVPFQAQHAPDGRHQRLAINEEKRHAPTSACLSDAGRGT